MAFSLARRLRDCSATLTNRLSDPARREGAAVLVLVAYALVWTLYGVIAKSAQDVHFDMAEIVGWSRDLALGYPKHPPVAAYVAALWFGVFPAADWSYYLLAMVVASLGLWFAWKIAGDYLDPRKRVAALALLTLVPFFNFHALKFSVNTVLIPLWAATAWFFLRAFERRDARWAVLAGIAAALAIATKYWSVFLLLGLGMAALLDRRRAAYFRSAAPWLTILAGAVVLAPHVWWLADNGFAPFSYALDVHGGTKLPAVANASFGYLLGALAYVAAPVLLVVLLARPSRATLADAAWPADDPRRLVALAFWLPLLLPAVVAPLTGVRVTSLWTMSSFALLATVLLSSRRLALPDEAVHRVVAIALCFPFVMLALSALISVGTHLQGIRPTAGMHARQLAGDIARLWRETTDKRLRFVGGDGDLAYGAAFYLKSRPSVFPWLSRREAPWITEGRIAHEGIALVCVKSAAGCVQAAETLAARGPRGRRAEVEIARPHFGLAGTPERYVIITVPPAR